MGCLPSKAADSNIEANKGLPRGWKSRMVQKYKDQWRAQQDVTHVVCNNLLPSNEMKIAYIFIN